MQKNLIWDCKAAKSSRRFPRSRENSKSQQLSQAVQEENNPMYQHRHPSEAAQSTLQTLINVNLTNLSCFTDGLSLPFLMEEEQGTGRNIAPFQPCHPAWGCGSSARARGHRAVQHLCSLLMSSIPAGPTTSLTQRASRLTITLQSSPRPQQQSHTGILLTDTSTASARTHSLAPRPGQRNV